MLISRICGKTKAERSVPGRSTNLHHARGKYLNQNPPSRPETRAVSTKAAHSGAIRVANLPQKRPLHKGKMILALSGIAATFAWLTGATNHPAGGDVQRNIVSDKAPATEILQASIATPTFFFDDASNALAELDKTALSAKVSDPLNIPSTDPDLPAASAFLSNPNEPATDTVEKILPADEPDKPTPIVRTPDTSGKHMANGINRFAAAPEEKQEEKQIEQTPTSSPVSDNLFVMASPDTVKTQFSIPTRIASPLHAPDITSQLAATTSNRNVATATAALPADTDPVHKTPLPLASSIIKALNEPAPSTKAPLTNGLKETTVTVQRGDTLSVILNKHGVSIDQMPQLLGNNVVEDELSNLEIGQQFHITNLENDDFHSLTASIAGGKRVTIKQSSEGLKISSFELPIKRKRIVASGTIQQSLYLAAERANLKQSTIMELADIFQWELDFARDIRKGDHFSMVYDKLYREGEYIGDGDILAAEFVRGGKTHTAIRFTTSDGKTAYYSPDGSSKQRTFLRHPVDVVRITSRFNPNRLHPVLHKIRAHRGVDYGAPYGSPIYATADGTVKYAGSQNAYGNTVILKHGEKFSTLYAHMSKISSKSQVGKKVQQGDVIGYVGKSGRVTGVHLHYEFRVNGVQIDPLAIELPAAKAIDSKHLVELKKLADAMQKLMHTKRPLPGQIVAQIDDESGGPSAGTDDQQD